MTDKQELKKKLAEWAGFTWLPYKANAQGKVNDACWLFPGYRHQLDKGVAWSFTLPNFPKSLNACFEHLVPEALEILTRQGYVPPIMKLFQLWYDELVSLTGDSSNVQQAALALCPVMEKLIDST